jgi:hypothetical protein
VVEVLSPSNRMVQVNCKLDHYFGHGTKLAWLVNWQKQQVHFYTPDSIETLTGPNEALTGGAVLPGFKCRLNRLLGPMVWTSHNPPIQSWSSQTVLIAIALREREGVYVSSSPLANKACSPPPAMLVFNHEHGAGNQSRH